VSDPKIRAARSDDLEIIEGLLKTVNLPLFRTADFLDTFWVAEAEGEVVACVGLEVYDDAGLLRSAVVTEPVRGTGLGRRLTQRVIEDAKSSGIRDLYLFTMDAGPFFGHMGFEKCTIEDFSENGRKCSQWIAVNNNPEIVEWLTSMRMTLV
jgi:amino-acid N-acetyltransferase